jgi:hypothetical protein
MLVPLLGETAVSAWGLVVSNAAAARLTQHEGVAAAATALHENVDDLAGNGLIVLASRAPDDLAVVVSGSAAVNALTNRVSSPSGSDTPLRRAPSGGFSVAVRMRRPT